MTVCVQTSNELTGKEILLGVTGGIAAYKSAELVRLLEKSRCRCRGGDDGKPQRALSHR